MNAAQSLPPPLSAPSPLPPLSPSSPSLSGLTASSSQEKAQVQPQAQQLPSESTAAEVCTAIVFVVCASQSVPVDSSLFLSPPLCLSGRDRGGHQVRLQRGSSLPAKTSSFLDLPSYPLSPPSYHLSPLLPYPILSPSLLPPPLTPLSPLPPSRLLLPPIPRR